MTLPINIVPDDSNQMEGRESVRTDIQEVNPYIISRLYHDGLFHITEQFTIPEGVSEITFGSGLAAGIQLVLDQIEFQVRLMPQVLFQLVFLLLGLHHHHAVLTEHDMHGNGVTPRGTVIHEYPGCRGPEGH